MTKKNSFKPFSYDGYESLSSLRPSEVLKNLAKRKDEKLTPKRAAARGK